MKIDAIGYLILVLLSSIYCNRLKSQNQGKSRFRSSNVSLTRSKEIPKLMDSVFIRREVNVSSSQQNKPANANNLSSEISVSTNDARDSSINDNFNSLESPVIISRAPNKRENDALKLNELESKKLRNSNQLNAEAALIQRFQQAIIKGLE